MIYFKWCIWTEVCQNIVL